MNPRARFTTPPADSFSGYDIPFAFGVNLILFSIFRVSYYVGLASNAYIRRTPLSYFLIGAALLLWGHGMYFPYAITPTNFHEQFRQFFLHGMALFGWYIFCLAHIDYQWLHFSYMSLAAVHSAFFWWQANRVAAGIKSQAEEFRQRAAAKSAE